VFAATVNRTVPLPEPLAPELIAIHGVDVAAVHPHPAAVCTSNDRWPPSSSMATLEGDSRNVQPSPCVMLNVCPAMVRLADLDGPVVAATLNCTWPLPLPLVPEVIVTHGALLAAVHAHPSPAVTVTVPAPPPGVTDWLCGEIEKVHPCVCETDTC
jgi:hypothetical protein